MTLGWGKGNATEGGYPTSNTFADLPDPIVYASETYIVLTATGIWPFNRKPAGLYHSDGAAWSYMSAYPDIFKDGNFGIQNSTDGTKAIKLDASEITTGNTRTLYAPDHDLHLGQENIIQVRNETGITIPAGSAVYPSGISGGMVLVSLADASDKYKCRLVGITAEAITTGSNGWVIKFGLAHGVDTSTFGAGNVVYLSATIPGGLTVTKPTGSSYITQIGAVKSVAVSGDIVVDINTTEFSVEASSVVGWSPTDTATIAFVDGTRTLTVSPTGTHFSFYQYGDKYSKTTDSIQIDDTEGLWAIYYNLGNLQKVLAPTTSQVSSLIRNNPLVAYIYWNAADNKAEYFGQEMHGIGMDSETHNYAHFAFGARYINGLLPTDVLADGSGNSNTHAQFGMSTGAIADEDLYFNTNTIASTVGLPIAYLAGAEATPALRFTTNAGYSILTTGTGRMAYNAVSAGNWSLIESTNSDFVCCHVLALNENAINKRVVSFVGQVNYTTSALARAGAPVELRDLKRAGILPQETVQLATFIFQTADAYTNAVNARIISIDADNDWIDWTGGAVSSPGSSVVQSSFSDADFELFDDGDISKKLKFQTSSIATGQTRTITVPDRNLSLITPTFTGMLLEVGASHPVLDFQSDNAYRFIGDGTQDSSASIGAIINFGASGDTYKQVNLLNSSSGSSASADYVITSNDGTDSTRYVDLGINSSGWTGTGLGQGARNAYLYAQSDELHVFTAGEKALRFGINSTEYARIHTDGKFGIGTEVPTDYLQVELPSGINTINKGISVTRGSAYFRLGNATTSTTEFVPTFWSSPNTSLAASMAFVAHAGNDSDVIYNIINFSARNKAGTGNCGATQKAVAFTNYATDMMVIAGSGSIWHGTSSGISCAVTTTPKHISALSTAANTHLIKTYSATLNSCIVLSRSLGTTIGTNVATTTGANLGSYCWEGVNSSLNPALGAYISAFQNGAVGASYVGADIVFFTGTNAALPVERMRLLSNGYLGLGVSTPLAPLHVYSDANCFFDRATATATAAPGFVSRRARGTQSSPTAVQNGDYLAIYGGRGYDGSDWPLTTGYFVAAAEENFTATNKGTGIYFAVTPTGSTTAAPALFLYSTGVLRLAGDTLRVSTQKTPASAGAAGTKGDICHDANYIYVCTATNTWKRAGIATW